VRIQLTTDFVALHTMTIRYSGVVNTILSTLLPIIEKIPLVLTKLFETDTSIESVKKIMDNQEKTSKTIADIDTGLKTGDVSYNKKHSGELQKVTQAFTSTLPDEKKPFSIRC
jgi:hypothetical protein